jgi:brefeldin A-inhibited guanine nucleotide-exchange protein
VFLSKIFLRVGFTEFVFQAKGAGIESLRSLYKDPVLLTQIFLNYDCDFDARICTRISSYLTKLGGKTTSAPTRVCRKLMRKRIRIESGRDGGPCNDFKAFLRALAYRQ